ncbi:hypothetical protein QYF36_022155 [Acer negundo]|nr:hypothetical protein QYF36_022155 [Acer negundo]
MSASYSFLINGDPRGKARVLSDGFSLADLFSDDGGWHSDPVRQCFSADEANIILSIPLSIKSGQDALV